MTKSNITEYDNTAANNTDVEDVPLGENLMYPSHVNNAFREMMADLADVNDGTVSLTSPSFAAASLTGNLSFGDNDKAIFGAGTDLQIYHDGSNSAIQNATGELFVYGGGDQIRIRAENGEESIVANPNGSVDLYHNNSAKLATTSTGINVLGSITATEATFSGNTSVKLPAGTDAQRPTGVNGMLRYNSDDNQFEGYADGAWGAIAGGGETSLLQYNYTATAGQTTFSGSDDNSATLAYTAANLIVTLNGIVLENGTDYTASNGTSIVLAVAAALNDELNIIAFSSFTVSDTVPASTGGTFNGNVSVTGNLGVGTTSPAYQIDIQGSNNNALRLKTSSPILRLEDSDDNAHHTIIGSSDDLYITSDAGNTGNGNMIFRNGGSDERMRINSSGNVGINTSSVFSPLHLGSGEAAPSASGNMANNGLTISNGVGGRAIQIGVDDTAQGAYIQSGYVNNSNVANNLSFYNGASRSMTIESNGNLQHLSKPAYFARAWVNFNGSGTVAIRESGNVSSVTDLGTGDYRVNFSTAMTDADYSIHFGGSPQNGRFLVNWAGTINNGSTAVVNSTSNCRIAMIDGGSGSRLDSTNNYVSIFR